MEASGLGAAEQTAEKATILIADDEESLRDIASRVLASAGYKVLVANDGAAAIQALRNRADEIRLVLTDVVMPGAGAEVIVEFLDTHGLEIPVVYTSGYSSRHVSLKFLDGADIHLLRKPYNMQELLGTVSAALQGQA